MNDRSKTVMSWLEGLTEDDWKRYHSDSEVQETAKAALELLKEQEHKIEYLKNKAERLMDNLEAVLSERSDKMDEEIVRCKDCKWYDPVSALCDNCGLPRELRFFCADGRRR